MQNTLYILIALLLWTFPAAAWNGLGHRTVAELAWRQMDAAERQAAADLLRQHPHYKQILTAQTPPGVDTNHWAFLTGAVWLDLVRPAKQGQPPKPRSITKYDVYPHAIGHPFRRPAERGPVSLDKFVIAKPNAEMVLSNALVTLRKPKASARDRAVSLCVALHLFGDLHQPLHTANLVTRDKPKGHGLGGSFLVRDERGEVANLHTYWDYAPGADSSYSGVMALADSLAAAPELQPARLPEYQQNRAIPAWVQETYRVAVDFSYAENRVKWALATDVKSGKVPTSAVPALTADYVRDTQTAMRRRLAIAGLRLRDALKQAW
ncbi:MAG TPA: S1/P1 nuclease [Candidatus Paceibacterota bacterium]|nr:S1/P1 nuclease [Verrucomicrobiota bacterium]HSA09536.1 S1/P1 nuclease [Candidatus Paceibacterota bacterium]